ncbi:small ribosomal subunit biogenesis GTPase RsgA 1, mitochondrial [Herrania umbratica]|uniref:Small ribosomal subunit biogenesis GTPase RsgA 1, mitochondrial n=1 Tax=Herrania umbratica TaxID=108875 RepID=A0A6J1B3J9_9ROSI|nr:small ribosomal subunit biogenesis GTPase RsgA 1, mitochondrial [Herrania umbratica]
MPITSFSLFRNRAPAISASFLRHLSPNAIRHLAVLAATQNVSRKPQPNKNLLRAKHTFKEYSSLAHVLSPNETPSLSESQAIGTVAAAQANFMRVIVQREQEPSISSGKEDSSTKIGVELLCVVKEVLKKIKRRVLVGDKVVVGTIDWVARRGMIENVFQRSSEILDPPVANVDHLLVLFSMEQPMIEPFMLTRFLVEAESTGIPLTLALNKLELVDEETLVAWKNRLQSWGYEPLFCSVETKHGLDSLAFYLRDQTSVIVGPSGVGKSSLINVLRSYLRASDALEGDNWFDPILGSKWFEDQRVGEVSTRSGRGKHTTRHVSLLPLSGGGYLADTPGFNQPSLMKVTKQSLAQAFPEIRKMLKDSEPVKCSFNDCLHLGEPGCIVKSDWERYSYYFQLLDEIRIREEFQLRTFGTKREGDVRYKVGDMGVKQAEPRLEPKKYRRQSRKRINQSILEELDELDDDDSLDLENDPIVRAIKNENQ